jgi:ketosteroid isomerase-like protein
MTHPNEELIRREFEAVVSGDMPALMECYSDDHVLHYPGRNRLSGDYRGREGLSQFQSRVSEAERSSSRGCTSAISTRWMSSSARRSILQTL